MNILFPYLHLLFWLAVCQLPGLLGTPAVQNNLEWYQTLSQPPLTPPNAVFGIMWSILYLLFGFCAWKAFYPAYRQHKKTIGLFIGQLVLNAGWTPLFFGLHALLGAFFLLLGMLLQASWLEKDLFRINRTAGICLAPYLLWLGFALYLNAGFWILN